MEPVVALTLVVFVITYGFIATERIDKTIAALLGGSSVVVLGLVGQEEAFAAIDLNVIFLLAGMMILAGILRRTGFFQWLAIRSVKVPVAIVPPLIVLSTVWRCCRRSHLSITYSSPRSRSTASVRVSPVPFLISEIWISIGGTARSSAIPNILIGSAAGLGFVDFLANMTPIALAILAVYLVLLRFMFGRDLAVHADVREAVLALDEREALNDVRLLRLSLIVLAP
jgi:Na+/H+ antiporter NhaD/arsenite permease-like protein